MSSSPSRKSLLSSAAFIPQLTHITVRMSAILLHRFLLRLQSANRRSLEVSSEGSEEEEDVTYATMEFGGAVSRGSTLAFEEHCESAKDI